MKIPGHSVFCVLLLLAPVLHAAPAGVEAAARAAAAQQQQPAGPAATNSLVKFVASKEQVDRVQTLLKNKPVTSDYLAAIFERSETNAGEYRVHRDVECIAVMTAEKATLDFVPLGHVYVTGRSSFYLQWDGLGASTLHYYGPFYGTPESVLGLTRLDLRSTASAAPAFGPVIEGVIGYGPSGTNLDGFNLDAGKPIASSDFDPMSERSMQRAGANLYFSPIQNNLKALTTFGVQFAELATGEESEGSPQDAWNTTTASAVREAIAQAGEFQTNSRSAVTPGIYAFSTGKNLGLLQISGYHWSSPNGIDGVKFRYKLVRQ